MSLRILVCAAGAAMLATPASAETVGRSDQAAPFQIAGVGQQGARPTGPPGDPRANTPFAPRGGPAGTQPNSKGQVAPPDPDAAERAAAERRQKEKQARDAERGQKRDQARDTDRRRTRDQPRDTDRRQTRDQPRDAEPPRRDTGVRDAPSRRGPDIQRPDPSARSDRAFRRRDPGQARNIEDLRRSRGKSRDIGNGRSVIEEADKRVIIKRGDRIVIQQDEVRRVRRFAPNARREDLKQGRSRTIVDRPGGVRVISESDRNGRLLRRYRVGRDGRERVIVDNRRRGRGGIRGRDLAIGAGVGIGVVAGAVLLDSLVNVPEPRVRIPRDKYIVDYDRASEEDVYDALTAPPVGDYSERYTLDEIRATQNLRERMRRVDLNDVTFEFGSWEIPPGEYRKLERVARAMKRAIRREPDEVFMIEGHTDAVGDRVDNLTLSDRRAESVAQVLVEEFNVPFENLVTQGYGEDYLKIKTQSAERLNRRVAVRRITPLLNRDPRTSRYDNEDDNLDDNENDDDGVDYRPDRRR